MVVKDFEFNMLQDASCNAGASHIHGTDLWPGQPRSKSKSLPGDARGNTVEYWTPGLCSATCCLVCSFCDVSCYFSDSFNRWASFSVCICRAESCLRLSAVTGLEHVLCFNAKVLNPLNAELNSICHLLALLGVHHFLHVSRIRVKSLTLRLLMSYIYIYGAPILDVSRSHTTTHHSR